MDTYVISRWKQFVDFVFDYQNNGDARTNFFLFIHLFIENIVFVSSVPVVDVFVFNKLIIKIN